MNNEINKYTKKNQQMNKLNKTHTRARAYIIFIWHNRGQECEGGVPGRRHIMKNYLAHDKHVYSTLDGAAVFAPLLDLKIK